MTGALPLVWAIRRTTADGTDLPNQHRDVRYRWMNGPGSSTIAGRTNLSLRATGAGLPCPRRAVRRLRWLSEGAAHSIRIAKGGGLRDALNRLAGGLHALPHKTRRCFS